MDQHSGRPDEESAAPSAYGDGAGPRHSGGPAQPGESGGSAGSAAFGTPAAGAFGTSGGTSASGGSGFPGAGERPPLPVRPRGRASAGSPRVPGDTASAGSSAPAGSSAAGSSAPSAELPRIPVGETGALPPRMRIPYGEATVAPAPSAGMPRIPPAGSIARASAFPPGAGRPEAADAGHGGELELAPRRTLDVHGGHTADVPAATGADDDRDAGSRALGGRAGMPELPGGTGAFAGSDASGAFGGSGGFDGFGVTAEPRAGTDAFPYAATTDGAVEASDGFDPFGTGRTAAGTAEIPDGHLPEAVERALTSDPFDAFGAGHPADRTPYAAALDAPAPHAALESAAYPALESGRSVDAGPGPDLDAGFGAAPEHAPDLDLDLAPDLGPSAGFDQGYDQSPGQGYDAGYGRDVDRGFDDGQDAGFAADFAADDQESDAALTQELPAAGSFDGFAAGSPGARRRTHALPVRGESAEDDPAPRTPRPARDPLGVPEIGSSGSGAVRVRRFTTTDFLVTVNPVDGSEVVPVPPDDVRVPVRRTAEERAVRMNAARPAPPPGPPAPELPLLEREEERERLIRLLARGRTVRVTGPSGSGRTALLDAVVATCGDLAPEGVLRLSGHHRTAADLMYDLYALVYAGEEHRPSPVELTRLLADVGAVVVLDDLEFGGTALEELLDAASECAFLLAATPDVPAPAAESAVEEVFLPGLSRAACMDLLVTAAGRPLAEDETAWAADLWFESEGLPLRFVQAGALLRQRDAMRQPDAPEPTEWDDSVWEKGAAGAGLPGVAAFDGSGSFDAFDGSRAGADAHGFADFDGTGGFAGYEGYDLGDGRASGSADGAQPGVDDGMPSIPLGGTTAPGAAPAAVAPGGPAAAPRPQGPADDPLPSLAQSAAPAEILASRLGESAREALAFAVALDGECPHPSHLPALVGDTHGDAALGELTAAGLAVPVAGHFRLAAGVVRQLAGALRADGDLTEIQAHTAALHYTWWSGHRSVTPERVASESEAIVAAMSACARGGNAGAAVLLARTVAPVFAAALHWGAWERTLRIGKEAAEETGEVAEEAYFLHELGVLELCTGRYASARVELEASLALRGVLADRQGTVVGRRTLALVEDRDVDGATGVKGAAALPGALASYGRPAAEPDDVTTQLPAALDVTMPVPAVTISKAGPAAAAAAPAGGRRTGSRRNLLVVGAGLVLVAVIGTVVVLGSGDSGSGTPDNRVQPVESVPQDVPADPTRTAPPSTLPPTSASPSTSATTTTPSASPSTTPPTGGAGTTAPSTPLPTHTTTPPTSGPGGNSGGSTSGGTTGTTGTTGSTTSGTTGGTSTSGTTDGGTTAGTTGSTTAGTSGSTTTGGSSTGSTTGSTTDGGTTGATTAGGTTSTGGTTTP